MITVHLTKLETALEQVRKAYPKLRPTDAALVASALSLTGRHAIAIYDGNQYKWPEDYDKLTHAMVAEIDQIHSGIEPVKKTKAAVEEEPISISVGLMPNLSAGEQQLEGFDSLKAVLSQALQEGVEFAYLPIDIGWQWALDRANWNTVAGKDVSRRIKVKTNFTEGAVGIEQGTGAAKKRSRAKAAATPEADVADVAEVVEIAEVEPAAEIDT